jgi:hypothetical protein
MTDSRQLILAAAGFLALGLWVGPAAGDDPPPPEGDPSSAMNFLEIPEDASQAGALQDVSSGNGSASLGADSDTDAFVVGNTIGDNSTTGDVAAISANSGGINVNFANSGNNVVMQNSMAVNIYLGPQH